MEVLNLDTFKEKIFNFEASPEWKFLGALPTILDFYADWCGPCHALSPILDEISTDYQGKINVFKINTEESPELAALFGVRGIPALLFIPMTGEPAMSSGFAPKESLQKAIEDIFQIKPCDKIT